MAIRPPCIRPAVYRMPWMKEYARCRAADGPAMSAPLSNEATTAAARARTAVRRAARRLRRSAAVSAMSAPI